MPHPTHAFAFNEHSLVCCDTRCGLAPLLDLINRIRGWDMNESRPLIAEMKRDHEFDGFRRGKLRDKIEVLVFSEVNAPKRYAGAQVSLRRAGIVARGFSIARHLGGFAVSWPCTCGAWANHIVTLEDASGASIDCRHLSNEEHLKLHWQAAIAAIRASNHKPPSFSRVDGLSNSGAEVPQVHFTDNSALNADGAWKHGERTLSPEEAGWLREVGWVVADATVEVR